MTRHHLYAYGTLQLPQIISLIVGRPLAGKPATLAGYARYCIADRVYPAIVEAAGASVAGVVYQDLGAADIERLDMYEGPLYDRRELPVIAAGVLLSACTYVLRPEHAHRLSNEPWDLEQFERDHLATYLARVSLTARAP